MLRMFQRMQVLAPQGMSLECTDDVMPLIVRNSHVVFFRLVSDHVRVQYTALEAAESDDEMCRTLLRGHNTR